MDLSNTLSYINLTGLVIGLVVLCGPMNVWCPARPDRGWWKKKFFFFFHKNRSLVGQQGISNPVSLIGDLLPGLFSHLRMYLSVCVREKRGDGEGPDSSGPSDTLRYINLTGGVIGLVTLSGPMYLCPCVSEEHQSCFVYLEDKEKIKSNSS